VIGGHAARTTLPGRKWTGVVVVCAILGLEAQDCGTPFSVVSHFDLPSCPSDAFSLPQSAEDTSYRLSADVPQGHVFPTCPGVTVYRLLKRGKERMFLEARLKRGQSCTLDVSYTYVTAGVVGVLGGGEPDTAREERARPLMALAARLLMQGSGVTTAPASRTERLRSYKALRAWCRGTLDTGGRFDDPQSEVAYCP